MWKVVPLALVGRLLGRYGYAALVLILGLDSSGVPWPTEATLVVTGVMSASNTRHFSVYLAALASLCGAMLGSSLSYYMGRRMGPALMQRIASWFRLTPAHLDKVDQWFLRYGHRAVFFGRLVPFVRNLTGYPAGVIGMPFGKYLAYSTGGYGVYISIAMGMGYAGTRLARWFSELEVALWILIPLALAIAWFKWGRKWVQNRWGKG